MSLAAARTPADLDDLALVRGRLAEASRRLSDVSLAADSLAEATAWQTPAADRFRAAVATWRDDLAGLDRAIDAADADARWLHVQLTIAASG